MKSIFLSKTFWSGVLMLLAAVFPHQWELLGLNANYIAEAAFIVNVIGRFMAGGVSITGS